MFIDINTEILGHSRREPKKNFIIKNRGLARNIFVRDIFQEKMIALS